MFSEDPINRAITTREHSDGEDHGFISHAHGESELASLLKTNLVEHFIGLVNVFVSSDFKSIGAGEDWYSGTPAASRDSISFLTAPVRRA